MSAPFSSHAKSENTVKFLKFGTPKNFAQVCCNPPKIQIKRPNLRVFCKKDANGIANSEDPDQTAPLALLAKTYLYKNLDHYGMKYCKKKKISDIQNIIVIILI